MKTFYVASSSDVVNRVRSYVGDLIGLGWTWHSDWDWTKFVEIPADRIKRVGMVLGDLSAAASADVFVALLFEDIISRGTYMELGYRLATHKTAHVVLEGANWHLFFDHPSVMVHDTWADFLKYAKAMP